MRGTARFREPARAAVTKPVEEPSAPSQDLGLQGAAIKEEKQPAAPDSRRPLRGPQQIVDVREELRQAMRMDTQAPLTGIEDRLLKPLSALGFTGEMRELAAVISRDILARDPNVRYEKTLCNV